MNTSRHIILFAIVVSMALPSITSAATMQVSRPWVQASGLVGYWSFNNLDVTDKVYDRSGQGNNAYFEGGATSTAKVSGRLGQGVRFDGVNDEINIPVMSTLTGASDVPFSWSFWIRTTVQPGAEAIEWGAGRRCRVVSLGYLGCTTVGDEYGGGAISGAVVNDGNWHHAVYTYTPGAQSLYVDGRLEATAAQSIITSAVGISLGWDSFSNHYEGSLDEVRIYNRALTVAEVNALYRAGSATVAKTLNTSVKSGLVGWWTFDGKDVLIGGPASGDTGWVSTGSGGTLAGGTLSWANTGNITTSNDVRASVTLSGTAQSDYLRASNFGFSIPADATIVGIEGDIERRRSGGTTGQARDYSVRLVDDTGTLVGSDKAYTANNWPTTEGFVCDIACYGGPTDTWGTTLTPAQINDPDFGYAIQVNGAAAGADRIAEVDNMELWIYYTTPSGALDRSGSGNHGSITGAGRVAGKVGQGMQFDGATSLVNLGASAITNFANPMSTCAWVRSSSVASDQTIVVNSYNNDINNAFNFYIANSEINFTHASGGVYTGAAKTSGLTKNSWAHFCATWSGGTTKLYKDGIEMTALTGDPSYMNDENLIGSRVGIFDRVWNGTLDDVRIYSRALTGAEVKKIYNEGLGATVGKPQPYLIPSGLIGYWSFNGPDFTDKVYDRSGQNNHGYVVGAATSSVKGIGKMGQGVKFDGVDDEVDIPNIAGFTGATDVPFTWSWWRKSTGESGQEIGWSPYRACQTLEWAGGTVGCLVDGGGTFIFSTTRVNDGVWHHIVFTHNSGVQKLYVDGVLENTGSQTFTTDGGYGHTLGVRPFGTYYNGFLDEVRIYNRALSAAEVKRLYQSGK